MNFRNSLVFLLLLSAGFSIFSQEKSPENAVILEIPFGEKLSHSVETSLKENGFSPLEQPLATTGQDSFAYNVILEFPKNENTERSEESTSARDTIIFSFTQEDFFVHKSEILDFLAFLHDLQKDFSVSVLFSALDFSEFTDFLSPKGTQVFASSIDDADSSCAIAISIDSSKENALFTGSKKRTTPLFLTQQITDSFFEKRIRFNFEDTFSAIYRLGLIDGKERLSYFFENEIPAIEIVFKEAKNLSVLKEFAQNYSPENSTEWDMHYIYIDRANIFKGIFINEKAIIIICLCVGILTILILCVFSFTGRGGERQKYKFIKSSYMIPITVGISFLSLILGQNIVAFFLRHFAVNPVFQFGIKIVFSLFFISILFAVQEIFRFSVTAFVYGYLLSVVSIFNIFLFTTRDLTLFVLFAIEYIIIYISRSTKKLGVLIFFFVLMTIPFMPYGYVILKNASDLELSSSILCSPLGNFLLSFAMFPFQIMWLKILMFMNIYAGGKGYSMRRIIFNDVFSTLAILTFVFSLIFSISHFVYKPSERAAQRIETKIVQEEKNSLSASLGKDSFSGMDTNHLKIASKEEALRYEVTLFGINTAHPIYDSIYDYTVISEKDGTERYSFTIPDFPPKEITIDYASETGTKSAVEITAFYRTEVPHSFRTEKRELRVE